MGLNHTGTDGLHALRAYDSTHEPMRALLKALLWDKSQITDELVHRYQASATRPGAIEGATCFSEGHAAVDARSEFANPFSDDGCAASHENTRRVYLGGGRLLCAGHIGTATGEGASEHPLHLYSSRRTLGAK